MMNSRRIFFVLIITMIFAYPATARAERGRSRLPNPLNILKPVIWNLSLISAKITDEINKGKPFEEFTRPTDIQDRRSLMEKAQLFEEEIAQDFLKDNGRLFWSLIPNDLGDMAIWQGYHTAFRAYKYAVTKSTEDLTRLSLSLEGQALLMTGYGQAYLVRGIDPWHGTARHHRFFHEGEPYNWVDDASGSSLSGMVFGLDAAYRLGDPKTRRRAQELIVRLAKNLIEHDYKLVNSDGRPTRYGDHSLQGWNLAIPRMLTTVSLLNLAHAISSDPLFAQEKAHLLHQKTVLRVAAQGEIHLLWNAKEYHQHLAFMNYLSLLAHETNPEWREIWLRNFKKLMARFRKEGNSFFVFVYGSYLPVASREAEKAIMTLHEFNFPKMRGYVFNSRDPEISKAGRWSRQPLPVWRRPNTDIVWQRNPYLLDGKEGVMFRYSGVDFLLAYWMGRKLGFITPAD